MKKSPSQMSERAISVIRLGFARITCFPAESCSLLAVSIAYKVLKHNNINYI